MYKHPQRFRTSCSSRLSSCAVLANTSFSNFLKRFLQKVQLVPDSAYSGTPAPICISAAIKLGNQLALQALYCYPNALDLHSIPCRRRSASWLVSARAWRRRCSPPALPAALYSCRPPQPNASLSKSPRTWSAPHSGCGLWRQHSRLSGRDMSGRGRRQSRAWRESETASASCCR